MDKTSRSKFINFIYNILKFQANEERDTDNFLSINQKDLELLDKMKNYNIFELKSTLEDFIVIEEKI